MWYWIKFKCWLKRLWNPDDMDLFVSDQWKRDFIEHRREHTRR